MLWCNMAAAIGTNCNVSLENDDIVIASNSERLLGK